MYKADLQQDTQQSLREYLGNWAKENLPDSEELSEGISPEVLEEVFKSLEQLADSEFQDITQDATAEFISAIETTFQDWAKTAREELDPDVASHPLYAAMRCFFDGEDWPYVEEENELILYLVFQGEHGQWHCLATAREEEEQFVFYSIYPQAVPKEKQSAIAEFITRANYGMILGNFELDYSDGEIRYKTSIDVEDVTLTEALIRNLVYTNVMTMDQYLPGLLAVAEQGVDPKDAIAQVEAS